MRVPYDYEPGNLISFHGPMFSGKTEALITFLREAKKPHNGRLQVQTFKWSRDDRGEGNSTVRGKAMHRIAATPIEKPLEILDLIHKNTRVVGIDEVQFFPKEIVRVVRTLTDNGLTVAVAGLPRDFRGKPFGSMPELIALSQEAIQFAGKCTFGNDGSPCKRPATETQRIIDGKLAKWDDPLILIGGKNQYRTVCKPHFEIPGRPKAKRISFLK